MDWNGTTDAGFKIVVRDEGDTRCYSPAEYLDAGGRESGSIVLTNRVRDWKYGVMEDEVQFQPEVVERAREEGCRPAEVTIPGWLSDEDDDLPDIGHPGGSAKFRCLVEDYSEDAWRIVGMEQSSMGDYWYTWCWEFVPKSSVKVVTVYGNMKQGRRELDGFEFDGGRKEDLNRAESSP